MPILVKVTRDPVSILTEPQTEQEEQRRRPGHLLGVVVLGDGVAEQK